MSDDSERQRENRGAAVDASRDGGRSAADAVRQKTMEVLRERIRLLGLARSGAYEHYNLQLENGFPIPAEIAALEFIHRHLPNLRSYHEIGSGLGTLPFMLAYCGFASVGIERDVPRHLTATTILRELSLEHPHIESNCRLIGASFPDAVADLDVSESMAILTDFVSTQGTREYIRLCEGLARYRYVLLDLQRFCDKRESEAEEDRLVEELRSHGLSPTDHTIDLSSLGHYRLFESTRAGELRQLQAEAPGATGVRERPVGMVVAPRQPSMEVAVSVASTEVLAEQVGTLPAESIAPSGALRGFSLPPLPAKARDKRFGGWLGVSALLVIGIPAILGIAYYGFIASRQYVTSFQFAVRGPSQASAGRVVGAAMMQGAGAMSPDSFVVTDYINSAQALVDIEKSLDVQAMFSRSDVDFWSRLRAEASREELISYWARMVSARFDLISGNILVSVHGFAPQDSLKLAEAIVAKADEMFRRLNNQAHQDMVRIADDNVGRAQAQLSATSRALVEFRQKSGLMDPTRTAQAGASIVDELRRQLSTLHAQAATIRKTTPNSPALAALNSQIGVIEGQIKKEEALEPSLVQSVSAETLARYQSLEIERLAAERLYTEALSLRNQAYLIAQNQQSYLALFVAPTLPQASIYPNRLRAIVTVIASAALAWFVGMLTVYAIRDHLM